MGVYLDFNASAPIDERVLEYMVDVYRNKFGNADSRTHDYGDNAREIVEGARKNIAKMLCVQSNEVIFTSGATESNNLAIQGLKSYAEDTNKKHIITTSMEHKSILESVNLFGREGFEIDFLDPNIDGYITVEQVVSKMREDTLLVSVMHVNNETGIIQPVKEIGLMLEDKEILFHIDATQSFGKLVEELQLIKYNMMSISSHKIAGPQGIGALILKKYKYKYPSITPLFVGGKQEHGMRPGTVPVALCAGFGKAVELVELEHEINEKKCNEFKKKILQALKEENVEYMINGKQEYCVSSTLNISFKGVSSEALMLLSKQYCGISNGSACNSNTYNLSYVLKSMKLPEEVIEGAVRISWNAGIKIDECMQAIRAMINVAKSMN